MNGTVTYMTATLESQGKSITIDQAYNQFIKQVEP
jgi:hypothetical protein